MRTLLSKRTHSGDPDEWGEFGCNGCMGRVRAWSYDAVIGVGGVGKEPTGEGIAGKLTRIGIGPLKRLTDWPDPVLTFDHYLYFGTDGRHLCDVAPLLAERMYATGGRTVMTFTAHERREVDALLALAATAPPSPGRATKPVHKGCRRSAATYPLPTTSRTSVT